MAEQMAAVCAPNAHTQLPPLGWLGDHTKKLLPGTEKEKWEACGHS